MLMACNGVRKFTRRWPKLYWPSWAHWIWFPSHPPEKRLTNILSPDFKPLHKMIDMRNMLDILHFSVEISYSYFWKQCQIIIKRYCCHTWYILKFCHSNGFSSRLFTLRKLDLYSVSNSGMVCCLVHHIRVFFTIRWMVWYSFWIAFFVQFSVDEKRIWTEIKCVYVCVCECATSIRWRKNAFKSILKTSYYSKNAYDLKYIQYTYRKYIPIGKWFVIRFGLDFHKNQNSCFVFLFKVFRKMWMFSIFWRTCRLCIIFYFEFSWFLVKLYVTSYRLFFSVCMFFQICYHSLFTDFLTNMLNIRE